MSGHSKWSKVKHQKAGTDAAKSQAFTKVSRAITLAVREGGGITDPEKNFRLRLAIEKAREVNMPKETIDRAIERAVASGGSAIEQVLYEGYGPGGVAFLVEATTDNRQRTVANIKQLFDHAGGTLASPGAVSYLFNRSGVLVVGKVDTSYDKVLAAAINTGAEDVRELDDAFEVYVKPQELSNVAKRLTEQGIGVENTVLVMKPTTPVSVSSALRLKLEDLAAKLEDLEDVQQVYTNLD